MTARGQRSSSRSRYVALAIVVSAVLAATVVAFASSTSDEVEPGGTDNSAARGDGLAANPPADNVESRLLVGGEDILDRIEDGQSIRPFIGEEAHGEDLIVLEVLNELTFWVGSGTGARVLTVIDPTDANDVLLDTSGQEPLELTPNLVVQLTGTVRDAHDAADIREALANDRSDARALDVAGAYLHLEAVQID